MAMPRHLLLLSLLVALAMGLASAQEKDFEIAVEKADYDRLDEETLRFLRENRDFLRAQLDRLRQLRVEVDRSPLELSARDLLLRELMAEIDAGEDSLAYEKSLLARQELMQSVGELEGLEDQLDRLQTLLDQQADRLMRIEADYADRQRTALLIYVQNFPSDSAPAGIILEDEGSTRWRIELDSAQQEALRAGGAAQLLHEFVEPREQTYSIRFVGGGFDEQPARELHVAPVRDRLNLLSIDLAQLDEVSPDGPLLTESFLR